MITIIIKALVGLFIWLVFGEILCKQCKLKKNAKKFVNIACKIVGIAIVVIAGIDFIRLLLNFH